VGLDQDWLSEVSYSALADGPTTEATYTLARSVVEQGIPGDLVECGVYAGAQCAMMARALMDLGVKNRRVHLFDSFEGIPIAGEQDEELKGKPAGISACSIEDVMANMRVWKIDEGLLEYHKGLFADTVPQSVYRFSGQPSPSIDRIAFLRLDGDLYRSTKVCMEHLYPKLSRGGWMCVDDYNLGGARQAVHETLYPAPIYWRVPTK